MSVRLLERKDDPLGIGIGVSNGALLNYTALNKQNGSLNGCSVTRTGSEVYMEKVLYLFKDSVFSSHKKKE